MNRVRRQVAEFFGGRGFITCFGANATDALNILIQGMLEPGCHVVSTRLEHNSVLRPLFHLRQKGICTFDLVPFNGRGQVEPEAVARAIRPETCLVVVNHVSNVLGTVQPVVRIGNLCRERDIPLILDVSQSAGVIPVHMQKWGVAGLAFTGHKALMGPSGIGGLVIDPALPVEASRYGGTGIDSAKLQHSPEYPERLEAGTLNLLGILTLGHCLTRLNSSESTQAVQKEHELLFHLLEGLKEIDGVVVHCPDPDLDRIPLISCNLDGWSPSDAGMVLDGDYEIAVRTGLHCAPLVHRDLGNGESGAIRISLGPFNTTADLKTLFRALTAMSGQN